MRNYTRWRQEASDRIAADILGTTTQIEVDTATHTVLLNGQPLTPDEARLIGVRLIDGAVIADGDRAIRKAVFV